MAYENHYSAAHTYYQDRNYGNYQFTSLRDIVDYFMVIYVGEGKIIPKAKKMDVAFHAQRAMQELSFDTFKSFKAYEVSVPSALTIPLPYDYVNYTKIVRSDAAGIEHVLYPTSKTSNPQPIQSNLIEANDSQFATGVGDWDLGTGFYWSNQQFGSFGGNGIAGGTYDDSGVATTVAIGTKIKYSVPFKQGKRYRISYTTAKLADNASAQGKFKISIYGEQGYKATYGRNTSVDYDAKLVENGGERKSYVINLAAQSLQYEVTTDTESEMLVFEVVDVAWAGVLNGVVVTEYKNDLNDNRSNHYSQPEVSATWSNYSSATPSENQNQYDDDTYWPMEGSRYGLDPQHAQANGSFYIDPLTGLIHFSSNLNGQTVIIKYVSDGLGTLEEMKVHKFAEDAMYKWITHGILSGSSYGQALVPRLTKEKFAATRKAKLRLSNIKLEELTQILRGKSKQIKH